MEALSLSALVAARLAAKREEDAAIAKRRELDAAIVARVADGKASGTASEKIDGYKVTVTLSLNRKVTQADKLKTNWQQLPPAVQAAFRWKPEVEAAELKKLSPEHAALASYYITTEPGSPSIKIEAV